MNFEMTFLKNIFTFFEFLLFLTIGIFSLLGYTDGLCSNIPFITQIYGLPLLIIFGVSAFSLSKNPENKLSLVSVFGISVLTFALIHMSTLSGDQDTSTFLSPLYFIVILGTGVFGNSYSWIIPFIFFVTGDLFYSSYQIFSTDTSQGLKLVSDILQKKCISYIYLFVTGTISSIAHPKLSTTIKRIVQPQNNSEPTTTINPVKPQLPETSLAADLSNQNKTQFFTIEYTTGLSQNQAENVQEVLSSVVYFMCRNFKSYSALGFIFNPSTQMFLLNSFHSKSLNIIKETQIPLGTGVVGKIGSEKRSFMSGDYSFYSSDLQYYQGPEEINSILAVPVISENNEVLGTLVIDSTDKNAFKEQDKEILKRFSSLAAALITNTRIRIFQERSARTFQIFYEASHKFTTALNLDEVFTVLFQIMPLVTPCSRQIAVIYNEFEKTGIIYRTEGTETEVPVGLKFPLNSGLYSFVLKKRKLVYVQDYLQYENKYFRFVPDETRNPNIRSLIVFPIIDNESRCRGLFSIESNTPGQFHNEVQQIMSTLLENASVAFTRALLYKRMETLATTDGLTELNNHRQFQELLSQELERSRRYNRTLSLLLMDIDHFKTFNDTYGHPVGDLVLKEISNCIRQSLRANDIPSRYGGEEFTVILPETNDKGGIAIAERIRSTIENHVIHSLDRQLKVTVSIGCASYLATRVSQKELIDRADKALYYSKEHGRNIVSLFSAEMKKAGKK